MTLIFFLNTQQDPSLTQIFNLSEIREVNITIHIRKEICKWIQTKLSNYFSYEQKAHTFIIDFYGLIFISLYYIYYIINYNLLSCVEKSVMFKSLGKCKKCFERMYTFSIRM